MTKILIIESQLNSCNIFNNKLGKYLQTKGFDVVIATSGSEGVSKAQWELPDLIICSISMPEFDGYEVIKTLRENSSTVIIPFILVADKFSQDEIRQAMEIGADDCVTKCCTHEELLKAIAVRLDRQAFLKMCYAARVDDSVEKRPDEPSTAS